MRGAAAAIHQAIVDLADNGSAIIVISQDLDELLAICDEMAVINEGKLSKTLKVGEASVDEIGLLMGWNPRRTKYTSRPGGECPCSLS